MRVYELQGAFGLDHLELAERPKPEPGHGQVLLRLNRAALNYRDVMMVDGRYNPKQKLPLVPCSDGVGVIEAVGPGVSRVAVGERVAPMFAPGWTGGEPNREKVRRTLGGPLDGTLSEYLLLDAEGVSKVPDYLSDDEAATLPCAALTAWNALMLGGVKAGDTVLVQGTGGVSLFALQFAKILGARVIATSSSFDKLRRVTDMGAWQTINYAVEPNWGAVAKEMTGGAGVDQVIDIGGSTLEQSLRAVRIGGTVSSIGVLGAGEIKLRLASIFMQQVRLQGVLVGSRESFEAMCRALEAHRVHPMVDRVFPFEEAKEAFVYVANAQHFGKICIEV